MKLIQRIRKQDGEVIDREKLLRWFNRYLDTMPDGDRYIEFTNPDRTDAQNKYYWVVLGIIAHTIGTTPNAIHEYCKGEFLPKTKYIALISEKNKQSTSDLTKDEMTIYMDKVIQFAAEQGIIIPDIEQYKHYKS